MNLQGTSLSEAESEPIIRDHLAGKTTHCPRGDGGILDVRYDECEHSPTEFNADCRACGEGFILTRQAPAKVKFTPAQRDLMVSQLKFGKGPAYCLNCGARLSLITNGPRPIPLCRGCHSRP
jgi:hypothetical protein